MMKKIALGLLSLLFPFWAFASTSSGSLSFAPPPTDVSVIFLGNIFGIVDGVLHGTGSQIMGTMFGVFNSAVLALGGIVIMYTLIVSTMNTAQEGQMLGQKWSSIWIPLRSTLGLALLIPKASGYCLMQIFVMWVIVQGVGAADKVWSAALGYLNTGGVFVQAQMNPQTSLTSGNSSVASGATTILQGQVCMLGVQKVLQNALQSYLIAKESPSGASGPCVGKPSDNMKEFCATGQIPDFLSTVNAVTAQTAEPDKKTNYTVSMPNFSSGAFAALNGICGTLAWSPFSASDITSIQNNISAISPAEIQTAKMSRAIAIQQMYKDLATSAQIIVANDPALNAQQNNRGGNQPNFSNVAIQQFGVPILDSGSPCREISAQCIGWGRDPSNESAPLFNGTEFQGAISDYNGVMLPTLNLVQQSTKNVNANKQRDFIQQANSQGWLLAGSYFFNLSMLNASSKNDANLTDSNTGLDSSTFDSAKIVSSFSSRGCLGILCEWLENKAGPMTGVVSLINGINILPSPLPTPSVNPTGHKALAGIGSSTVNGFINNSVMVNLPGQPGMKPPDFAMKFNLSVNLGQFKLESQTFPCGEWGIWPLKFCLGRILGDIFYNGIILILFNFFLSILAPFINIIIQSLLVAPLIAIAQIFQENVAIIQQPLVNPIAALAGMGVNYINFANELWITIIGLSATPFIMAIFPLLALILPLLMSWLGIMVAIGFITAYYIPFLPYMIFTFASIAWLMAVIEAMVAAPIVALGVTHPEGHDAFGKGEQAIMILMNVFLRPSMMIIGYIAAIGLSYVSVWIINAGFANAAAFIQGTATGIQWNYSCTNTLSSTGSPGCANPGVPNNFGSMGTGYSSWAGIYGFFFSVLIYTTMYLTVVQKAFTLITYLPDKVLRWIGGQPEGIGEQTAQWAEESKKEVEGGAKETGRASAQRDQQLGGYATSGLGKLKDKSSGGKTDIDSLGGKSTQSGE
jgi:defect-in-organelle-trafficking protein DotA